MTLEDWFVFGSTDSAAGDAKDETVRQQALKSAGLAPQNLVTCKQVHSDRVHWVSDVSQAVHAETDGLITDSPDPVLGIYTADCVPAFLVESKRKVIGMVHAGWRGAANEIVAKGIEQILLKPNARVENLRVHFGPHIQECCYEVGEEVAARFRPEAKKLDSKGKWRLSLRKALALQARRLGVPESNITSSNDCTRCNPQFFSFRRDGTRKRMLSFAALKSHG